MSKLVPKLRFKEFSGEWEENKIVIKIVSGNNYPLNSYLKKGVLLVQGLNINPHKLILDNPIYISSDFLTGRDVFIKKNDILMGLNRPIIDNKLKICLYKEDKEAVLYQRAGILKFNKEKLSNLFLYYYLSSDVFLKQLLLELVGSDQPYIKSDLFKKTKNIFPKSPKEQQKIANTLSSLDNLIEAYQRKVEALQKHKKGLMQHLFPAEGANVPKLRFKEFSREWEEKKLGEIVEYFKGFAFKSQEYSATGRRIIRVSDMGFDYIKSKEAKTYINEKDAKKYNKWKLRKNDLIVTTVGSKPPIYDSLVGRSIVVKLKDENSLLNQNAVCLRANEQIKQSFLNILFKKESYIKYIETIIRGNANQGSIALKDLFEYRILLPKDTKEQQKIANTLSSLDSLIEAQQRKVEALKKHKKGLMQQMFVSGED